MKSEKVQVVKCLVEHCDAKPSALCEIDVFKYKDDAVEYANERFREFVDEYNLGIDLSDETEFCADNGFDFVTITVESLTVNIHGK